MLALSQVVTANVAGAAIGAIALAAAMKLSVSHFADAKRQRAREQRMQAQKPGVVYLFQFPLLRDVHTFSGFCTTIETFLRLAKIPYEVVDTPDPSFSPTGRLPYIELNGVGTADSDSILKRLAEVFPDKCGSNKATTLSLAVSHVVRKMLLRGTRMHYMRWVWVDNADIPIGRIIPFIPLPAFISRRILLGSRTSAITYLNEEGQGDLSDAEYHAQFLDEMIALETLITDPGVQLTNEARAAVYAILDWLWYIPDTATPCPAAQYLKRSAKLQALLRSIEAEAFPDMQQRCPGRDNAAPYPLLSA